MNRVLKQILYSLFYLSIVFAFLYFGTNLIVDHSICEECVDPTEFFTVDIVEEAEVYSLSSDLYSVVVGISNTNEGYDAEIYYNLRLLNNGSVIKTLSGDSFIFQDTDLKYLTFNTDLNQVPDEVDFQIVEVNWVESSFERPELLLENISINLSEDQSEIIISGDVTNQSSLSDFDIDVSIFLRNDLNVRLFAAGSEIFNVDSFSSREFSLALPVPDDYINEIDLDKTDVFLSPTF